MSTNKRPKMYWKRRLAITLSPACLTLFTFALVSFLSGWFEIPHDIQSLESKTDEIKRDVRGMDQKIERLTQSVSRMEGYIESSREYRKIVPALSRTHHSFVPALERLESPNVAHNINTPLKSSPIPVRRE